MVNLESGAPISSVYPKLGMLTLSPDHGLRLDSATLRNELFSEQIKQVVSSPSSFVPPIQYKSEIHTLS